LAELSIAAQTKVLPLIEMTRAVPATFVPKAAAQLAGRRLVLSGSYRYQVTGDATGYLHLFNALGNSQISVIPSTPIHANPGYLAVLQPLVGTYGSGIVVTISLVDLPAASAWIAAQGWAPSDVDLLIKVGDVAQYDPLQFSQYVTHALQANLASGQPWRSVALNAHAAPIDHSNLPPGRTLVPRRDWQLWAATAPQLAFQLDYSDWGHVHASMEEVPGFAMANATVSVRYAIDDYWIVRKGTQISGPHGQPMSVQYRNHAIALAAEPAFNSVSNCWGDGRVQHYATTAGGTGGRSQWAALLLNRHMSLVADRLP
jgi:hypothetical protein